MRNIFLFIRRSSVFIGFLILQIVCLYMLFNFNRFHRIKGMNAAGAVTTFFNGGYNKVENYFNMQEENRNVHHINDSLLNLLNENFVKIDTSHFIQNELGIKVVNDSTQQMVRQYKWRSATVLYTTVNSDKNYIQINRGSTSGIAENMAVFSSNGGVVGKVVNVGDNFSEIMSLLHVLNKLSIRVKRTNTTGTLGWDGKNPNELTVLNIPRADSVKYGDTIVTGNYSQNFPSDKLVGVVSKILNDKATNSYILKIKPKANFATLQQVFVVENINTKELEKLHEETLKKVEKKPGK